MNRTKIDKKITKSTPITFLLCGFSDNKDLSLAVLVTLFPTERKAGLFFINPLISFNEEKLENISDPLLVLANQLENITNRKVDYKLSITESNFVRLIDILGGLPIYFDPMLIRKNSDNYERKIGEYLLSGEEVRDFLRLKNPDSPSEYLERLWNQETVTLVIHDRIIQIQKEIKKQWILLFSSFFTTDLIAEEFVSIFNYLLEGHLILYISEMPAEPITITDGKTKKIQLNVKEEVASIAYSKFISELRSEDFADGEFARIEILNGTDINGLAKQAKSVLNEKRIKVLSTDNGWINNLENTLIIDRSGNPEYAHKVAGVLGIKNIKHIIDKEVGLDTTIIIGEDFEIKPGKK